MASPQALLSGLAILIMIFHLSNLFNPKAFRKALKKFLADENSVRLAGVSMLFISFFLLSSQWRLEDKWMSLVALFGWIALFKGLAWIWNPKTVEKYVTKMLLKNESKSVTLSIIAVLVSLFLLYASVQLVKAPMLGLGF